MHWQKGVWENGCQDERCSGSWTLDGSQCLYSSFIVLLPLQGEIAAAAHVPYILACVSLSSHARIHTRGAHFHFQGKIAAAAPVRAAEKSGPAQYIRYTAAQQGAQFAGGSSQRIIKMVEMPSDPMEPPKFQHKKVRAFVGQGCARRFRFVGRAVG